MNDTPDRFATDAKQNGARPVSFTLDGRQLTSADADSSAEEILRLGGLDPAGYDLRLVRAGQAPVKPYADDRRVRIKDGDAFLSVRQSAQVA